jgi:Flp pilus assembly protein TadD
MTAQEQIRRAKIHNEAEGYLELGLAQQALDCLGRLGDPAAFEVESLYLWGEGLRAMDRYFEALVPLERAVKAAPEDIRVRMALGWCYKRTGRLDLAIQSLEAALANDPTEAVLHYNLACYLSLAGEKRRSLRLLADALAIDPRLGRLVDDESDFIPLRSEPEFQSLRSQIGI